MTETETIIQLRREVEEVWKPLLKAAQRLHRNDESVNDWLDAWNDLGRCAVHAANLLKPQEPPIPETMRRTYIDGVWKKL